MRILISNDDGIYSPGIVALAKVASRFGEVRIVAPDVEQSSMGHAITASRPLRYKRIQLGKFEAYRVNGTPADCVALGTHHWQRIDLVLSGINLGLNLGNSCWHSGTLAAAKQAALLGLRGIAISTAVSDKEEPDFSALEPYVAKVIDLLLEEKTMPLVNVNLPQKPRGIRWTRQSVRQYDGKVLPSKDPMGRPTTGSQSLRCVSISPTRKILPARWRFITRHQSLPERRATHKRIKPPGLLQKSTRRPHARTEKR